MRRKMSGVEEAIGQIADKLAMPELVNLIRESQDDTYVSPDRHVSRQETTPPPPTSTIHAQQTWEVVMDPESGPAAIPASCVSQVPPIQKPGLLPTGDRSNLDLITRGVVSLENAESFFSVYSRTLDHFLYRILIDHDHLSSVRKSSPLLTAAICAVGALHSASTEFDACHEEFMKLSAAQMFSKKNTADDVRALCIGAFWLSDASWALVGLGKQPSFFVQFMFRVLTLCQAVRIATEIELHRCISKMPHNIRACYLRTRLWYLVYVCDHHFSIVYGKPPMTHDFEALRPAASFLDSKYATEDDARLISQVEIWSINTRVFEAFGVDTDAPVLDRLVPQLRRFCIALDTWRANWNERFNVNSGVGKYPREGVGLHFHFAKLYLCSHAFRRSPRMANTPLDMSSEMDEFANTAVLSAISILRVIGSDIEMQSHLNSLPLYFDTMIAFTVVFLLKMTTKHSGNVRIDRIEILNLVDQLNGVLKSITPLLHSRHLLFSIATSIEKLSDRCLRPTNQEALFRPSAHTHLGSETSEKEQEGMTSPSEAMFLGNYDFLSSQSMLNGFDFDFTTFDVDEMQQ